MESKESEVQYLPMLGVPLRHQDKSRNILAEELVQNLAYPLLALLN